MIFKTIFQLAGKLYQQLVARDAVKNEFHKFALSKGSFKDQISAMTLRTDQFALTRLNHIDSLMELLSKDVKRHSAVIMPALIELFIDSKPEYNHLSKLTAEQDLQRRLGELSKTFLRERKEAQYEEHDRGLLPGTRSLFTFNERLQEIRGDESIYKISQMQLVLWYFEHLLKVKYTKFIEILDYYATESAVAKIKHSASRGLSKLLKSKPEGEGYILQCTIQKFGQNDKENVRRMTEWLQRTCSHHPLMKPRIIKEVNEYLNRPNLSPRGMWCAVSFLTKLKFTSLENEAATLLCGVYMDLFRQLIAYQNVFDELSKSSSTSRSSITKRAPGSLDAEVIKRVLGQSALHSDMAQNINSKMKAAGRGLGERPLSRKEKRKQRGKRKGISDPVSLMKYMLGMTDTTRKKYFKKHPKQLALWTRFTQFQAITSKLLAVVLRGMAYAFPFARLNLEVFKKDLDYVYRLALRAPIKVAVIALRFTFRVETIKNVSSGTDMTDLTSTKMVKHAMNRKLDVMKGLMTPSDRFFQVLYAICSRWDFLTYIDAGTLFNMIYRCTQLDRNKPRITAFVRRLLQFSMCGSVSWVCGALFLISAIIRYHPFLELLIDQKISALLSLPGRTGQTTLKLADYDLYETNPKLSKGTQCPMWELTLLTKHMHPAVRNFTKQLLRNNLIKYRGDPLRDFDQKVLFEKFSRMLAHQKGRVTPRKRKGITEEARKRQFVDSYADGDGFIAMYKRYGGRTKPRTKEEDDNGVDGGDIDDFVGDGDAKENAKMKFEEKLFIDEHDPKDMKAVEGTVEAFFEKHYTGQTPQDDLDKMEYQELKAMAQAEMKKIEMRGKQKQIEMLRAQQEADEVDMYLGEDDDEGDGEGDLDGGNEEIDFMEMARIEDQEEEQMEDARELDEEEYLRQIQQEVDDPLAGYSGQQLTDVTDKMLRKTMVLDDEMELPDGIEPVLEDEGSDQSDRFDDLRYLHSNGDLPETVPTSPSGRGDDEDVDAADFVDDDEDEDMYPKGFSFGQEEEGAIDDDDMDFFAEEGKGAGEINLDEEEWSE